MCVRVLVYVSVCERVCVRVYSLLLNIGTHLPMIPNVVDRMNVALVPYWQGHIQKS